MDDQIRFVHTNLIARDWKRLANFYIEVFGCKPVGPERDLSGEWVEKLTEIKGVKIRGAHLQLPGCENGPTIEIFQYTPEYGGVEPQINRPGFGHIAFHVDDVTTLLSKFIEHGGERTGQVVQKNHPELGLLTVAYARDPEGNFVEIQNWRK
ncbi:MAG TPA: VOC family protein [Methanocella sp.]|nr:VOC family protein [Methanocella sp.]